MTKGTLSEHEPAPSRVIEQAAYSPTAEEKKAIELNERLYREGKRARKNFDSNWLWYYKMFRGSQWKDRRPDYRHSAVFNLIWQDIQSTVPIITDPKPQISYIPEGPEDRELAEIFNKLTDFDWVRKSLNTRLIAEVVYDGHIYGTGFGCCKWDPDGDHGLGSIEMPSEDPFFLYVDPDATSFDDALYCVKAEPKSLSYVKKMYPEKGRHVKSDVTEFSKQDRQDVMVVKFKSPSSNELLMEGSPQEAYRMNDQCLLITSYIKDDEIVEEEKDIEENGVKSKVYEQKLKYPNGRKIVSAGGVLLEDIPNPYEDGKLPYARFRNYIDPRQFYGISDVEQGEGPQVIFNKLISFSLDVLTLMGNPIWIVDETAGVDTDNLFNQPGMVLEKAPGSEVRREEGVQLQPYVMALIDRVKGWFDQIQGANDVTRGVKPEGISAGVAISQLQDAAQTRIRQKSRNLEEFLQELGQLYLSRVLQFYTVPRVVRITGPNETVQQYFKFSIEDRQAPTGETVKVAKVQQLDPESGLAHEPKEFPVHGQFDVRVTTGSGLPFAKAEKSNLAMTLYDRGILDAQEVLTAVDYPNKEIVLERLKARQEAAAQQEAMQPPQGR